MEGKALLNDKSYYAVIFTSIQSEVNKDYEEMAELMISLAKKQPGFLGLESARSNGNGKTVSYWETEESIRNWKNHEKHLVARHKGRSGWSVIIMPALYSLKEKISLIAVKNEIKKF